MRRISGRGTCGFGAIGLLVAGVACSEPRPAADHAAAAAGDVSAPAVAHPSHPPERAGAELAASAAGGHTLGREPLTVTLAVPAEARERLAALTTGAAGSSPGRLRLVVEGLELLHPGAVYQVYLDPPADREPEPGGPSFVGHVAPYGSPGQTPAGSRTFDVTDVARAIWAKGGPPGAVRVTFVRSRGDDATAGEEPAAFLRFRRVTLVERPPAAPPGG